MRLYIIAGHGAGDCGARGNGYTEEERVRALAQRIKDFGGDNVVLADFNINAYKNNTIGKGLVPKDCLILELHLDSYWNANAKGGHVIIHKKFTADKYDVALAEMISGMFAGRSKTIVGRGDLANVNRARTYGYNYRLMECCFISNADDIQKFNNNIDELAKKILKCFDFEVKETPKETVVDTKKSIDEIAKEVINGKWGNGADRKKRLADAGHNYTEVQAKVNEILTGKPATPTKPVETAKPTTPAKKSVEEIAKEVINGKWGNGATRKTRLTQAGYNYAEVQAKVNQLLK